MFGYRGRGMGLAIGAVLLLGIATPASAGDERTLYASLGDTTRSPIGWVEYCAENPGECAGGATQARGFRAAKGMHGSTDLTDLRDTEIERLLEENARLNARVVALLKVIEREQANHAAETADETSPAEVDREAICREVRAALEAELGPVLVILLRLLQKQHSCSL